jgi:Zn-dependent peptidase ImmA (M78 family)
MSLTFAERLLQSYGVSQPEEIDLEAIAFDQGATVKYRSMTSCEARVVGAGRYAVISINSGSGIERQRFSLGHELGHWIQDKGLISLSCARTAIGPQVSTSGPERSANEFASQILMPDYIFQPLSRREPLTFDTVRRLAPRFRTSLTATAIKLVRAAHYPGMVVCYKEGRLAWKICGSDVPATLKPVAQLDAESQAYELWKSGKTIGEKPELQCADTWIDFHGSENYELVEHSIQVAPGVMLALLWWEDESQITDVEEQA